VIDRCGTGSFDDKKLLASMVIARLLKPNSSTTAESMKSTKLIGYHHLARYLDLVVEKSLPYGNSCYKKAATRTRYTVISRRSVSLSKANLFFFMLSICGAPNYLPTGGGITIPTSNDFIAHTKTKLFRATVMVTTNKCMSARHYKDDASVLKFYQKTCRDFACSLRQWGSGYRFVPHTFTNSLAITMALVDQERCEHWLGHDALNAELTLATELWDKTLAEVQRSILSVDLEETDANAVATTDTSVDDQ
jgi:hypothetical protein